METGGAPEQRQGFLYAAAYARRGRIGDAVLAHAVTNALLAGWVIFSGAWGMW